MIPYVYRSEGANGQKVFVATCPTHRRDVTIHPDRRKAERVVEAHDRLFHQCQLSG